MRFHTTLLQTGPTATGMEVPDEVVEALGAGKRPPVRVTINGYTYRNTIAVMGGVYMVGVSAEHRAGAGIAGGDEIDVDIELDREPRVVDGPGRLRRGARPRSRGPAVLRRPVVQPQAVARAVDRRGEDGGDPPAPDREVGRDAPRGPGSLSWRTVRGTRGQPGSERADGRGRGGGLSRLAGRSARDRDHAHGRRRLDSQVTVAQDAPDPGDGGAPSSSSPTAAASSAIDSRTPGWATSAKP